MFSCIVLSSAVPRELFFVGIVDSPVVKSEAKHEVAGAFYDQEYGKDGQKQSKEGWDRHLSSDEGGFVRSRGRFVSVWFGAKSEKKTDSNAKSFYPTFFGREPHCLVHNLLPSWGG